MKSSDRGWLRRFKSTPIEELAELPTDVKTTAGQVFNARLSPWILTRNTHGLGRVIVDFSRLTAPLDKTTNRRDGKAYPRRESSYSPDFVRAIARYMAQYVLTHAPSTVGSAGLLGAFINFERFVHERARWGSRRRKFEVEHLTADVFDLYCRYLESDAPNCTRYATFIRSFYRWGVSNKLEGFDFVVLRRIRSVRISQSSQGRVAEINDPKIGALSWEEERQIVSALNRRLGQPVDRAIVRLFWETGIRTEAAISIRKTALTSTPNRDLWKLAVPRVKKRRKMREIEFKDYFISRDLAMLLRQVSRKSTLTGFMFHWSRRHLAAHDIRDAVKRWAKDAKLKTTRITPDGSETGLPLNPVRFRRTLATNMAIRGATQEEIAEALDDESLGMAAVYAANASNMVEILEATLDRHPGWVSLIGLFLGRVAIDAPEYPEIIGGVSYLAGFERYSQRIGTIGWCSYGKPCKWLPPIQCYRCPHFVASRKLRPHEFQLRQLIEDADLRGRETSQNMATALVDDIAAILSVIATLKAEKGIAVNPERPVTSKIKQLKTKGQDQGEVA